MKTELIESHAFPGFYEIPKFPNYVISKVGKIMELYINRELIPYTRHDGSHAYCLNDRWGKPVVISKHKLLCDTFMPSNKPDMEIRFKNGIIGDDRLENLEWCASSGEFDQYIKGYNPEECIEYPGYFKCPSWYQEGWKDSFVISRNGNVVDLFTGKLLKEHARNGGYVYFDAYLGHRPRMHFSLSRSRFLCMVFKPTKEDISKLHVNHINGVPGDDRLENLEWCTSKENTYHAAVMGLTPKCLPVQTRDIDTGEIKTYISCTECAKANGMSKDNLLYRLERYDQNHVFPDRKQYRNYRDTNPEWKTPENLKAALADNSRSKRVQTRNLDTGEIKEYEKLADLAKELKVAHPTVTQWLAKKYQPVAPGNLQIKFVADTNPWREIKDPFDEICDIVRGTPVETVHEETGKKERFISTFECAKAHGLTITALHNRLAKYNGSYVFQDGYRYRYYVKK